METSEISEIAKTIENLSIRIVAIDGMDGAGKTSLSKKLQRKLKCKRVSLDCYLKKKSGNYIEFIDYSKLQNDIAAKSGLLLIEGTCCQAVLARANVPHDFLIYVKKYSRHGHWQDETSCDVQGDIDEFVNQEKESLLKFCKASAVLNNETFDPTLHQFPPFREELFRYHYTFRPHEVADIIFKRTD